jgi:hypothetical protein
VEVGRVRVARAPPPVAAVDARRRPSVVGVAAAVSAVDAHRCRCVGLVVARVWEEDGRGVEEGERGGGSASGAATARGGRRSRRCTRDWGRAGIGLGFSRWAAFYTDAVKKINGRDSL